MRRLPSVVRGSQAIHTRPPYDGEGVYLAIYILGSIEKPRILADRDPAGQVYYPVRGAAHQWLEVL